MALVGYLPAWRARSEGPARRLLGRRSSYQGPKVKSPERAQVSIPPEFRGASREQRSGRVVVSTGLGFQRVLERTVGRAR